MRSTIMFVAALIAFGQAPPPTSGQGRDGSDAESGSIRERAFGNYLIGAGDVLDVEVFELEELSKTVRVGGDGRITYPMLGAIDVLGKTTTELEATIRDALARKYIRDPQVIVFVREMQSGNVSVLGAVREPGGISVIGSATLIDALSRAGGMSPEAGSKAFMVRKGSDEPIVIDLRRLMEEGDLTLNFPVEAGDVIYVPKSRKFNVYVYGQVQSPGVFQVRDDEEISVLQAVAMAGGLARRASSGKVKIVRSGNGRGRQMIQVNLGNIIAGKALDVPLHEGDIVVVPKSFF